MAENQISIFYDKKVLIIKPSSSFGATVAPYWIGKTGTLLKWASANFYIVECEGTQLLLKDDEFEIIKEKT